MISIFKKVTLCAAVLQTLAALLLLPISLHAQVIPFQQVEAAQHAQYEQINQYLDQQVQQARSRRKAFWQRDFSSLTAYRRSIEPYRDKLFKMLGGEVYEPGALQPRKELVAAFPTHKAYRVWIKAFGNVDTYGILLVPSGKGPFPALVCIHGMGGTPEGVTGLTHENDYHNRFGLQAVKRGYVVFAPLDMNSAKKRSWLDRKAIMIGQRLQALEQYKLMRAVDYLAQHDQVQSNRIGAYGISWGGRSVMNLAALDTRISAVAISGHFNDLVPKMLTPSPHYTAYIETNEVYAFFWRHAQQFTDVDVVSLICPRPVFIEQGRQDRVAYWKMSKKAFGQVKSFYQKLGVEQRARYKIYDGAHQVFGGETFEFLDRWLQ